MGGTCRYNVVIIVLVPVQGIILNTLRAEALRSSYISWEKEGISLPRNPDLYKKMEGPLLAELILKIGVLRYTLPSQASFLRILGLFVEHSD